MSKTAVITVGLLAALTSYAGMLLTFLKAGFPTGAAVFAMVPLAVGYTAWKRKRGKHG